MRTMAAAMPPANGPNEPQRRQRGLGTVEQHGEQWRFKVRVRGRRYVSGPIPSQHMAELALVEYLARLPERLAETAKEPANRLSLSGWGERWIDSRQNRSASVDRSRWARFIRAAEFYQYPLRDITRRDVRLWLDRLAELPTMAPVRGSRLQAANKHGKRLSLQTQRHALNLLRGCLANAMEHDLIATNPATGVKLRGECSTKEVTFLSQAEIGAVLSLPDMPLSVRAALAVAIYAGLRQGEQLALRWEDVELDGEAPMLIVRRSHYGPTKTGKVRRVPLLGPAHDALLAWRAAYGRIQAGALVWPNDNGRQFFKGYDFGWADRMMRGKVCQGWKTMAGIHRRVRYHDLRHTCASHLVMGTWGQAWSLSEVAAMLGHSRTSTTEIYAHLGPSHLFRKAALTAKCAPLQAENGPKDWSHGAEPHLVPPTARPAGIEPATLGLEGRTNFAAQRRENQFLGPIWDQTFPAAKSPDAVELARAVVTLAAAGQAVPAVLVSELARAVLRGELATLADRALQPGPFQLRAGIDLAGRLLAVPTGQAEQQLSAASDA